MNKSVEIYQMGKKIRKIKPIGKHKVYDITVADSHCYITDNGVISHNTGIYYASNIVWFVGRQQRKVGTEIEGYNFIINVEKSRFVKEKSKIPITVTWDQGLDKYSGLFDIAYAGNYITKGWRDEEQKDGTIKRRELSGWFRVKGADKNIRRSEATGEIFWKSFLKENPDFKNFVKETYTVGYRSMIDAATIGEEIENEEA